MGFSTTLLPLEGLDLLKGAQILRKQEEGPSLRRVQILQEPEGQVLELDPVQILGQPEGELECLHAVQVIQDLEEDELLDRSDGLLRFPSEGMPSQMAILSQ